MKKIFIALFLIASFAVAYFIFFYDNNSLKARIRALAYEEDNVERYKMVKQMGKDYPGQPAVDEATLFKFLTQKKRGRSTIGRYHFLLCPRLLQAAADLERHRL